jgi:hypothetical protein
MYLGPWIMIKPMMVKMPVRRMVSPAAADSFPVTITALTVMAGHHCAMLLATRHGSLARIWWMGADAGKVGRAGVTVGPGSTHAPPDLAAGDRSDAVKF